MTKIERWIRDLFNGNIWDPEPPVNWDIVRYEMDKEQNVLNQKMEDESWEREINHRAERRMQEWIHGQETKALYEKMGQRYWPEIRIEEPFIKSVYTVYEWESARYRHQNIYDLIHQKFIQLKEEYEQNI